ncbi:MAG: transposase, partial [Nanoarchaeota archaeon]|nr:transposase [Nanoarchaeota archaeon]
MEYQMKLPIETKYSQSWAKYNLAKTNEKRLFYELLNELCQLIPEQPYRFGRPPIQIRDLVFISCLKIYNNFSSRKIAFDTQQAEMAGYIKQAPHINRISDFMNNPITYDLLQRILTITAMPLKNLEDAYSMDASGFGSYQYERWMRTRFSGSKTQWRNYVKGHICIGTRTNVIIGAEVTYATGSDISQAPKLLETLKDFKPKQVSADKAYSSYKILKTIDEMGADPYIAFKTNTNPSKKSPEIWRRVYFHYVKNKEQFLKQYHKRSNVETTFSMVKTRLGEFLKSKNYESQRNEVLLKFICH